MSERESEIVLLPLNAIRPAPFNMTLMQPHEEEMLREEMRLESKGLEKIDPILVRRLTAEEIEKTKDKYPYAKYEVVDGHTRFRIAQEFNWTSIKARVIETTWDQALDIAYRKNKERGTIDPLKEALYFKYLVQDKKTPPYEVAEQFQMKVEDVQHVLAKAIPNREARKIISEYEMYKYSKPIPSKILETIAGAPLEKQPTLAKAVVEGRLKPGEVEAAKEAILQGASLEEAIKIAKSAGKKKPETPPPEAVSKAAPATPLPPTTALPEVLSEVKPETVEVAQPLAEELEEITCPRCGAKAKIDWTAKRVTWE